VSASAVTSEANPTRPRSGTELPVAGSFLDAAPDVASAWDGAAAGLAVAACDDAAGEAVGLAVVVDDVEAAGLAAVEPVPLLASVDRKSTRLNSSHRL